MYIPKNTGLILNCYEIHHNEEKYPDSYATPRFSLVSEGLTGQYPFNRFEFKPERFLGDTLTCAESSKLPNAMDRDHWAFGAGYVRSFLLPPGLSGIVGLPFADGRSLLFFPSLLFLHIFECDAGAASARVSTSQNGSSGSRSRGCFGRTTSSRCRTSRYPWRNTRASLGARRYRIASLSRLGMIECKRCWRQKRKSR
jgi:hypothetical protein